MLLKFTCRIFVCDQFVSSLELSGSSISDQTTLFDPINLGVTALGNNFSTLGKNSKFFGEKKVQGNNNKINKR